MDLREEYLDLEETWWSELRTAASKISPERLELEVVPGWSGRVLLWHTVAWAEEAARYIERLAAREEVTDPFEADPAYGDRTNERLAQEGRGKSLEQIWTSAEGARGRVRAAWSSVPEDLLDGAKEWFDSETFLHYRDHTADLAKLAED
jgi:hypothetical protein